MKVQMATHENVDKQDTINYQSNNILIFENQNKNHHQQDRSEHLDRITRRNETILTVNPRSPVIENAHILSPTPAHGSIEVKNPRKPRVSKILSLFSRNETKSPIIAPTSPSSDIIPYLGATANSPSRNLSPLPSFHTRSSSSEIFYTGTSRKPLPVLPGINTGDFDQSSFSTSSFISTREHMHNSDESNQMPQIIRKPGTPNDSRSTNLSFSSYSMNDVKNNNERRPSSIFSANSNLIEYNSKTPRPQQVRRGSFTLSSDSSEDYPTHSSSSSVSEVKSPIDQVNNRAFVDFDDNDLSDDEDLLEERIVFHQAHVSKAIDEGKLGEAELHLSALVNECGFHNDDTLLLIRARIKSLKGEWEQTFSLLSNFKFNPRLSISENIEIYYRRAISAYRMNKLNEAFMDCKRGLKLCKRLEPDLRMESYNDFAFLASTVSAKIGREAEALFYMSLVPESYKHNKLFSIPDGAEIESQGATVDQVKDEQQISLPKTNPPSKLPKITVSYPKEEEGRHDELHNLSDEEKLLNRFSVTISATTVSGKPPNILGALHGAITKNFEQIANQLCSVINPLGVALRYNTCNIILKTVVGPIQYEICLQSIFAIFAYHDTPLSVQLTKQFIESLGEPISNFSSSLEYINDSCPISPLMIALIRNNVTIAEMLIKAGANVNTQYDFGLDGIITPFGYVLLDAIATGDTKLLDLLIRNGVRSVEKIDSRFANHSILHYAVYNCTYPAVFQSLLSAPFIDMNLKVWVDEFAMRPVTAYDLLVVLEKKKPELAKVREVFKRKRGYH